jgi:hypothetical protein
MEEPLRLPPDCPADDAVLLHAGGQVDSCSVCLRVFGDDLDPDAVSAMLGAAPTSACRKGDIHRGKRYDRVEKQGKWPLDLDHVRGVPLDDLINRLLDRLTGDLAVWRELTGRYKVDLFCGLQLELWNRGLGLSPRTLLRVGQRGLGLGLDIYYVGESEPEAEPGAVPDRGGM